MCSWVKYISDIVRDLFLASFTQFIQSIRTDGNDGKAFEVFCKWFLKNDPEWSLQVDEVWLWDEWPDKWGPG